MLNLTQFMSTKQIRVDQELHVIDGSDADSYMADPISMDVGLTYSTDVIYIGETYWKRNKWNGRMFRLKTGDSSNPATWGLSTLFQTDARQPISMAPSAAFGFGMELWVYFGTGRL